MEPGRTQFLAGSALTDQQHGPLDRGYAREPFLKLQEGFGLTERFYRSDRNPPFG
jgi:hypothetical protein